MHHHELDPTRMLLHLYFFVKGAAPFPSETHSASEGKRFTSGVCPHRPPTATPYYPDLILEKGKRAQVQIVEKKINEFYIIHE